MSNLSTRLIPTSIFLIFSHEQIEISKVSLMRIFRHIALDLFKGGGCVMKELVSPDLL